MERRGGRPLTRRWRATLSPLALEKTADARSQQRSLAVASDASWNDLERRHMFRANDREVPPIERRNHAGAEAFGGGYHRGIHCAERKIVVCSDKFCDANPVGCQYRFGEKVSARKITKESNLRGPTQARLEEIGNFSHDKLRHDQRTFVRLEEG